jgi:hypothetical protein
MGQGVLGTQGRQELARAAVWAQRPAERPGTHENGPGCLYPSPRVAFVLPTFI